MPTGANSLFFFSAILSITTFVAVARPAEHLQVVVHRAAALAPRRDMVALHVLKFEMLPAPRTAPALAFIGPALLALRKCLD